MIKKISITGGIGSGKSTVSKMLEKSGYCVWDADIFAREALTKHHVETEIKKVFGEHVYENGVLNRELVRSLVFADSSLKSALEDILHPVIEELLMQRVNALSNLGVSIWVFYEASLIFEKKRHTFFDANILVTADSRKRVQRVRKTKQLPVELIEQIMQQQMPEGHKKKFADFVIENSSTIEKLEKQVVKLIAFLRKTL